MGLNSKVAVAALAAVASAAFAAPASADTASPRNVAVYWVRALQRGDIPKACGVSTRIEPGGRGCDGLSSIASGCPAQGPGHPRPHVPARRPREQVERVFIDGDRATVLLGAEDRVSSTKARLTLHLVGDQWLTAAVHRHRHAFDFLRVGQASPPAPSRADDRLYSRLFLSGCVKPVYG